MRTQFTFIAILILAASVLAEDNKIPERLLLSTGQYMGSGARAMGLGGTFTGIADDYSAVWWNPAGISQVKRIEMQATLSRSGFSNETDYLSNPWDGATSAMRVNNLGFVFPVPVYQGALSFAFGYNQVQGFDRRARYETKSPGEGYWDQYDELEAGRLGFWTLAAAMDASPNLALGMGINYWAGTDEYSATGTFTENGSEIFREKTLTTDLSAWGANFGGLVRIGKFVRAGAMFQTPMVFDVNEEWTRDRVTKYNDYRMSYPAVFRLGGSFCPGRWLVGADLEYRDWTTLSFRTDTPYDLSRAEANQEIKDTYQGSTRLSLGGEYLFPAYGIRARAGYSFEPTNYKLFGSESDRSMLSFGLGLLVDRSVMLDVSYRFYNYTEKSTPGATDPTYIPQSRTELTEDIRTSAAVLTLSCRL